MSPGASAPVTDLPSKRPAHTREKEGRFSKEWPSLCARPFLFLFVRPLPLSGRQLHQTPTPRTDAAFRPDHRRRQKACRRTDEIRTRTAFVHFVRHPHFTPGSPNRPLEPKAKRCPQDLAKMRQSAPCDIWQPLPFRNRTGPRLSHRLRALVPGRGA